MGINTTFLAVESVFKSVNNWLNERQKTCAEKLSDGDKSNRGSAFYAIAWIDLNIQDCESCGSMGLDATYLKLQSEFKSVKIWLNEPPKTKLPITNQTQTIDNHRHLLWGTTKKPCQHSTSENIGPWPIVERLLNIISPRFGECTARWRLILDRGLIWQYLLDLIHLPNSMNTESFKCYYMHRL